MSRYAATIQGIIMIMILEIKTLYLDLPLIIKRLETGEEVFISPPFDNKNDEVFFFKAKNLTEILKLEVYVPSLNKKMYLRNTDNLDTIDIIVDKGRFVPISKVYKIKNPFKPEHDEIFQIGTLDNSDFLIEVDDSFNCRPNHVIFRQQNGTKVCLKVYDFSKSLEFDDLNQSTPVWAYPVKDIGYINFFKAFQIGSPSDTLILLNDEQNLVFKDRQTNNIYFDNKLHERAHTNEKQIYHMMIGLDKDGFFYRLQNNYYYANIFYNIKLKCKPYNPYLLDEISCGYFMTWNDTMKRCIPGFVEVKHEFSINGATAYMISYDFENVSKIEDLFRPFDNTIPCVFSQTYWTVDPLMCFNIFDNHLFGPSYIDSIESYKFGIYKFARFLDEKISQDSNLSLMIRSPIQPQTIETSSKDARNVFLSDDYFECQSENDKIIGKLNGKCTTYISYRKSKISRFMTDGFTFSQKISNLGISRDFFDNIKCPLEEKRVLIDFPDYNYTDLSLECLSKIDTVRNSQSSKHSLINIEFKMNESSQFNLPFVSISSLSSKSIIREYDVSNESDLLRLNDMLSCGIDMRLGYDKTTCAHIKFEYSIDNKDKFWLLHENMGSKASLDFIDIVKYDQSVGNLYSTSNSASKRLKIVMDNEIEDISEILRPVFIKWSFDEENQGRQILVDENLASFISYSKETAEISKKCHKNQTLISGSCKDLDFITVVLIRNDYDGIIESHEVSEFHLTNISNYPCLNEISSNKNNLILMGNKGIDFGKKTCYKLTDNSLMTSPTNFLVGNYIRNVNIIGRGFQKVRVNRIFGKEVLTSDPLSSQSITNAFKECQINQFYDNLTGECIDIVYLIIDSNEVVSINQNQEELILYSSVPTSVAIPRKEAFCSVNYAKIVTEKNEIKCLPYSAQKIYKQLEESEIIGETSLEQLLKSGLKYSYLFSGNMALDLPKNSGRYNVTTFKQFATFVEVSFKSKPNDLIDFACPLHQIRLFDKSRGRSIKCRKVTFVNWNDSSRYLTFSSTVPTHYSFLEPICAPGFKIDKKSEYDSKNCSIDLQDEFVIPYSSRQKIAESQNVMIKFRSRFIIEILFTFAIIVAITTIAANIIVLSIIV